MLTFENDELEVALITYNRSKFVKEWITRYIDEFYARNIKIVVYDSSTDELTKNEIEKVNEKYDKKIKYNYLSAELSVGHVVLHAIVNASSKYVWVAGDSRCHDLEDLDRKVFPYIKSGIEHIVLRIVNNEENDGKIYADKTEMLKDCLVSMTCTGLYIYKTAIFEPLKTNQNFYEECLKKYDDNYGFTWMGYFLDSYALNENYRTVFTCIPIIEIEPEKKVQRWNERFLKCWCSDLCNVIDGVSATYQVNDDLLKQTWKILGIDTAERLNKNREEGVLNEQIVNEYRDLLERVSSSVEKIESFAKTTPENLPKTYEYWRTKEELEFGKKVEKVIDGILSDNSDKEICIYGAGRGGKIIAKSLIGRNKKIKCFYDINAKKIGECMGMQVRDISEMGAENECILISLIGVYSSIGGDRNSVNRNQMYYIYYM